MTGAESPRQYRHQPSAETTKNDPALREFSWWLDHPRLYSLIGWRILPRRYPDMWWPLPARKISDEAVERGRELAEKYGWDK